MLVFEIPHRLRKLLVDLYPTEEDSRRVVHDAQLKSEHIKFSSAAITNWHAILQEAHKRHRVIAILDVAAKDYNERILDLTQAKLLYLVNQADLSVLDILALYQKSHSSLSKGVKPLNTIEDILKSLWGLVDQYDRQLPILEFVERLALHIQDFQLPELFRQWSDWSVVNGVLHDVTLTDLEELRTRLAANSWNINYHTSQESYRQVGIWPDTAKTGLGKDHDYVYTEETENYTIEQILQKLQDVKNLLTDQSTKLPERPKESKRKITWDAIDKFKLTMRYGRLYHQCRTDEKKETAYTAALNQLSEIEKELEKLPNAERPIILALVTLWHRELEAWKTTKPNNPFIFLGSLRGRKPFVGRDNELKALKAAGTSGFVQPVLLHGLVHSGKSSLIQQASLDYYENTCYTIVSIVESEKSSLSVKTVLWSMCQALKRRTGYDLPNERKFQSDPFAATEEMIRSLCQHYPKATQMIVIGNIDILYANTSGAMLQGLTITWSTAIADNLLNFWWRLAQTIGNLNFVFICQTAELPHNPFTPILKKLHVGPLEFKDIEKLLNAPAPEFTPLFSRKAAAQVYYLSGGQPYLAQLLAYCVTSQFNSELEKDPKPEPVFLPEDIDRVLDTPPFHQFSQNYFQQLRGQLETLQPSSNAVLQAIAPNADGISSAELEQSLTRQYTWAQVEKILAFLEAQQVIRHENQRWQIVGELLRRELNP